jgi:hypothetical protein
MNISRQKFSILSLLVVVVMASAAMPGQRKFKNLKVLPKNISEKELDDKMKEYSKALGVKCGYCHVKGDDNRLDPANDSKPEKLIARKMIKMTNQINHKYFEKNGSGVAAVSCLTCHRGVPMPDTTLIKQVVK